MKNQIFKSIIEPNILWDFLKDNGEIETEYISFSKSLYKKAVFRETIDSFIKILDNYYFTSKKYYITRKMDYIKFITILRQLCNSINEKYKTEMVYNKSSYEIVYHFYLPSTAVE